MAARDAATAASPAVDWSSRDLDWTDPEVLAKADPPGRLLTFGDVEHHFASLRTVLGTPAIDGIAAMGREHCLAADSRVKFTSPNYGIGALASPLPPSLLLLPPSLSTAFPWSPYGWPRPCQLSYILHPISYRLISA